MTETSMTTAPSALADIAAKLPPLFIPKYRTRAEDGRSRELASTTDGR
jgi:hypothetical protein